MRINIVLAVLAVVLAVPCARVYLAERSEAFVEWDTLPLLFPGFSSDRVQIIELRRRKPAELIEAQKLPPEASYDGIVFARDGDGWTIMSPANFKGLPADPASIEADVLDHIAALQINNETLVPAEKVDDDFRKANNLTEETAYVITCMGGLNGPELAKAYLGKSTKRGSEDQVEGYYVIRPDRPRDVVIYEPASTSWHMTLDPTHWAKKAIYRFLMSEVDRFSFINELGSAGFKRVGKKWKAIPELCKRGTTPIDLSKVGEVIHDHVDGQVDKFRQLNAERFVREKIAADEVSAENDLAIRVTLKDGTEYRLVIGPAKPGSPTCDAISSNHKFKFEIASFFAETIRTLDPITLFHPK